MKSKDWLPEVAEPLGITHTECMAYDVANETGCLLRLSSADDETVLMTIGGRKFVVQDASLAYCLAGARKSRESAREVAA